MLEAYKNTTEVTTVPSLDDIMEMGRNKEEAYEAFCEYILPAVVGRKSNGSKFFVSKVSEVATVSDEAMSLLLLENAWDKWSAQHANPNNAEFPSTKYSHDGSGSANLVYHGWKVIGMTRFAELVQLVTADRKTDERKAFEQDFLTQKQATNNNKRRKITFNGLVECPVIPNDLGDDLELAEQQSVPV